MLGAAFAAAVCLFGAGVAQAQARPAPSTPPTPLLHMIDQVGGPDRYQTAIDASKLAWADATAVPTPGGAKPAGVAVIARGDTYADALAGSALAAELGGPLLLTPPAALGPSVGAELHRILSPHQRVFLLGGTQALSSTVENSVNGLNLTVERL